MSHERKTKVLIAIGAFRLFKAVLLILVGLSAAKIMSNQTASAAVAERLLIRLKLDPANEQIHGILNRVFSIEPGTLRVLSIGSFIYAALFCIEGLGLIAGRAWAEWLVVVSSSLLLPYEIYEMYEKASLPKAFAIGINLIIIAYLLFRLRKNRRENNFEKDALGNRSPSV